MSQSDFDSQDGGTAACIGLMNECMSVELRSSFSYQVAAGRTMSEYSADVSIRKLRSTTRSILPIGASGRTVTSATPWSSGSAAIAVECVPR